MLLVNVFMCDSDSNCHRGWDIRGWGVLFSLWVEMQLSEGRTVVVHRAGPVCWDVWEQQCHLKGSHLGLGVSVPQLGLALLSP